MSKEHYHTFHKEKNPWLSAKKRPTISPQQPPSAEVLPIEQILATIPQFMLPNQNAPQITPISQIVKNASTVTHSQGTVSHSQGTVSHQQIIMYVSDDYEYISYSGEIDILYIKNIKTNATTLSIPA